MSSEPWRFISYVSLKLDSINKLLVPNKDSGNTLSIWNNPALVSSAISSKHWRRLITECETNRINDSSIPDSNLPQLIVFRIRSCVIKRGSSTTTSTTTPSHFALRSTRWRRRGRHIIWLRFSTVFVILAK